MLFGIAVGNDGLYVRELWDVVSRAPISKGKKEKINPLMLLTST